jgi:hypothetical protein
LGITLKVNLAFESLGVKLNNRLFAVSALLCILSLTFVGASLAQPVASGVKGGMAFDYYVSSYWSSSDPSYSAPADLVVANQTACIEIRIGAVNATDVETITIAYYNDGTTDFERGNINLYTGMGSGFVGVIGANLNVGDRIHPDGEDSLTVLDTTMRTYESGARATNHVRIVDDNPLEGGYRATRDLYFDKATGILVEQVDQVETTLTPLTVTRFTWKIASVVNVDGWEIPDFTLPDFSTTAKQDFLGSSIFYLIIGVTVLLVAITIVLIIYKKKNA